MILRIKAKKFVILEKKISNITNNLRSREEELFKIRNDMKNLILQYIKLNQEKLGDSNLFNIEKVEDFDITNNEIQILIKRKNIGGSYRFYLKGEEKKEFEQFSEFFLDLKQYNL